MRALYLKLVIIFFLLFGVVVFLIVSNQKHSAVDYSPPFYHKLKEGEWYGSLMISELVTLQSELTKEVINPFFSYDETVHEIIQDRLKDLGLYYSTIYFSGSLSNNEVYAYLPLNKPEALAKEMASIASTLDWKRVDTLEQTVYTTFQNDIKLILSPDLLVLTNTLQNPLDYLAKNKPKRLVDLDSLFKTPNQFAVQTPPMEKLGIDYINFLIDLSYPFKVKGSLYTKAPFPITKGTQSSVLKQANVNYFGGSNITIDTSLFTENWYSWFDKLQSKYGFPITSVLKSWDGTSSFAKGGPVLNTDTIITYGFDDNFNEIETRKLVKSEVEGFSILMGGKNSKNLIAAFRENNFLSLENGKYYFPMSPALFLENSTEYLVLSSSAKYEFQQEKNTNSFYIHALKKGWYMHTNIDRKSNTLLEFDVSVGMLEK